MRVIACNARASKRHRSATTVRCDVRYTAHHQAQEFLRSLVLRGAWSTSSAGHPALPPRSAPSSMNNMRSAALLANWISCVTMIIVMPWRDRFSMTCNTSRHHLGDPTMTWVHRTASPSGALPAHARSPHAAAGRRTTARDRTPPCPPARPARAGARPPLAHRDLFVSPHHLQRTGHDVFQRGHVAEQIELLEHHADMAALSAKVRRRKWRVMPLLLAR